MIIKMILDVIYNVFKLLTTPINIPEMPDEVLTYIDMAFDTISAGAGILANYTPLTYLLVLFGIILVMDVAIALYHFVMWVIKKIPFLGME